jgi:hypothetical protein
MVVGLVSGAGSKGGLIAIAAPDRLAFAGEAEAADGRAPDVAQDFGMLPVKAVLAACRSDVNPVFRAPSILPADLASEGRSEGDCFWAIGLKPSAFANSGQFRPPAHPSPKLATIAIVDSRTVRTRTP